MSVGRYTFLAAFICAVLIIRQKTIFSDGFMIPPYQYHGFMGGNYFPCNWGYSYCSYMPQDYYYYDNGCTDGCDYGAEGCSPCDPEPPCFPEHQSGTEPPSGTEPTSSPALPSVPEPTSGLEPPSSPAQPSVTTEENDSLGFGGVTEALIDHRTDVNEEEKENDIEEEEEEDEDEEDEEEEEEYYNNNDDNDDA